MIVVANPSGSAGSSFKGLHQYCAHDVDKATTSERVEWVETRNVAADPQHAYKVMIATAANANELKKEAGVKAGRKSTKGEVLHLVMSFDKDEPSDRDTINKAVDGMLAGLGADPAKMRGKSKPSRRQFADEHQAVLYVHKDTDNTHVHVMVNTVHPETGIRLPTSNNYKKLQNWAEQFSKEHGTEHKTPARQENREMRENGEYVKHADRPNRKEFEQAKELKSASNDNNRITSFMEFQKAKDAALFAKGRENVKTYHAQLKTLKTALNNKKAEADQIRKTEINKARSKVREDFRPKWRALSKRQQKEAKTFEALETTFWGRTKNTIQSFKSAYQEQTGVIARSFRILSSSGARKEYFEKGQARERAALSKEQLNKVDIAKKAASEKQAETYQSARVEYLAAYREAKLEQAKRNDELKSDWKLRNEERKEQIDRFKQIELKKPRLDDAFSRARVNTDRSFSSNQRLTEEFKAQHAREQDNTKDKDKDGGRER